MSARPQIVLSPIDPVWGTASDTAQHLVLVHPEIPANSGNIARLAAGTRFVLHLVKPLGYKLEDRYLKRAGLDYWPGVTLCVHEDWQSALAIFPKEKLHLLTTHTKANYTDMSAEPGAAYVFGRESVGLEPEITDQHPDRLFRIPMSDKVRSINLANACAIVCYDIRRRQDWPDMG